MASCDDRTRTSTAPPTRPPAAPAPQNSWRQHVRRSPRSLAEAQVHDQDVRADDEERSTRAAANQGQVRPRRVATAARKTTGLRIHDGVAHHAAATTSRARKPRPPRRGAGPPAPEDPAGRNRAGRRGTAWPLDGADSTTRTTPSSSWPRRRRGSAPLRGPATPRSRRPRPSLPRGVRASGRRRRALWRKKDGHRQGPPPREAWQETSVKSRITSYPRAMDPWSRRYPPARRRLERLEENVVALALVLLAGSVCCSVRSWTFSLR